MTSIIIYTIPSVLEHKQGKLIDDDYSERGIYYWQLNGVPKKLQVHDKIYFATEKFIRGYFEIEDISHFGQIEFNCKTWKDIKPIPTKSFQGFKYADKAEGLE